MAFDFKKEFKEFYMPKNKPEIVNVKPTIIPISFFREGTVAGTHRKDCDT